MGKCFVCNAETDQLASVYISKYKSDSTGTVTKIEYEKASRPLCTNCIKKNLSHDFSGAWFYVFLQLLWFKVAGVGIFSVLGAICAIIALFALWRLIVLLVRRWHQQHRADKPISKLFYRQEDYAEQASSMLKAEVKGYYSKHGMRVLTEREYYRTHKA